MPRLGGTAEPARPEQVEPTRASSSAAARERILDAAQQLFASRGFDSTPTKAIAAQAGVPSGLVFYYFPTKRSLLLTILDERGFLPELRSLLQAEMATQDDPRAALTAVGLRIFEYVGNRADVAQILAREVLSHPEVFEHWHRLSVEALRLLAEYLQAAVRSGRLRPVDVDVLARLFMAGLVVEAAFVRSADPRAYVGGAVDVLLGGLIPEGQA